MINYLICDLNIQKKGHYIGYNQYILTTILKLDEVYPDRKYSFLYNSEAKEYLDLPLNVADDVHFIDDNCWSSPSLKDKIRLFTKIVTIANQLKTDHLIFMDIDQYQFPIFITKFRFKFSGILFRPHHRITNSDPKFFSRIVTSIKRTKKVVAEKLLVLTKKVENIYILNDEEGVELLNKFHKTKQFKYLQDPIFSYPSSLQDAKRTDSYKFLIFGAINERKNITAIIKAYDSTSFPIETELLIVGSIDDVYLNYLNSLIKEMPTLGSYKKILLKSGFVTNEEMDNYFHQTNVCLLIYKDFYGSSGLLGRAALHKKKVIGPNVGLLKQLIEKNKLGTTCDPDNVLSISEALLEITNKDFDENHFESFYKNYSPNTFIKTLLS